ncbi:head decoration protein [uncultured Ruegeria sp.]|uniref:head decoration protein n=1 Tax=uncultured Ruegeria sp. TaxID=259304 RepID=UPI002616655D|nr:head decoration protein [uncultured Ruegeria sp.]
MAPTTMGKLAAEFLISEANNNRSRDEVTVDATAAALEPGTILGKVTASGDFVRHAAGASDGSENEAGILMFGIGAVEEERTIVARDAEVSQADLTYEAGADAAQITASNAALAALGIIVR